MWLSRRGYRRNCGMKTLIKEADHTRTVETSEGVQLNITAKRASSSYQYFLRLTTEEILFSLLMCPPKTIAEAVRSLRGKGKSKALGDLLGEVQKQLTLGAFDPEPADEEEERAAPAMLGEPPADEEEERPAPAMLGEPMEMLEEPIAR